MQAVSPGLTGQMASGMAGTPGMKLESDHKGKIGP
jgi:hypothetical protein